MEWTKLTTQVISILESSDMGKFWLAIPGEDPLIGEYVWCQGRYPHQFKTNSGNFIPSGYVTHIMKVVLPDIPKD